MATILLGFAGSWAADIEMVLAPPAGSLHAGQETIIRLFVHNHADREILARLPATVRYRLAAGRSRLEGEMARREPAAESVAVPPRGFVRALYALTLPPSLEGVVMLEAAGLDVAPVMFAVAREQADPAAAAGPAPESESIEARILKRFSGHEPVYFLVGVDPADSKFQISLKIRLFDFARQEGHRWDLLNGLHLAYTQTSFWDLKSESKPFLDSSYKPEVLYALEDADIRGASLPGLSRWGMAVGVQHESNGKSGADSRSINIAYLRPRFVFGDERGIYLELSPRVWTYVAGIDENPDIYKYRGYFDLVAAAGKADSLRIAATYRQGTSRASFQVDASYPLFDILPGKVALYLYAQYFNGYAESLLYYNQKSEALRFGIAVYR
jgi:outer membrane phospholipase A